MKLGIHVVWEPTAPNPKNKANRTSGVGDMAPQTLSFGKKRHGCQPLNPHISGTSDPICIKLVLMDRQFDKDSKYVTRSTEMRNKSGHVKSGKSTSKSIGDGFALTY